MQDKGELSLCVMGFGTALRDGANLLRGWVPGV